MSTSKTFEIHKNLKYIIKAKARGYYDNQAVYSFDTNNPNQSINMTPYDGLSYQYKNSYNAVSYLDYTVTKLPDNTNGVSDIKVLMPYDNGKIYYDVQFLHKNFYVKTDKCSITENNQCTLSGTSSYFDCTKPIPSNATKIKAVFKLNLTTNTESQIIMKVNNSGNLAAQAYVQSTSRYKGYFGGAVGGVTALTTNTTYWFGILEDATTIKGYLLVDNGTYTLDTLPDFDTDWTLEWTQNVTSTYTYKGAQELGLFNNNSQYWRGNIDLNNCKIWVDDQNFWYYNMESIITKNFNGTFYNYIDTGSAKTLKCFYNDGQYLLTEDNNIEGYQYLGTVDIPAHDLYNYTETSYNVYDNFSIIGTLTLNQNTGQITGFSASNYVDTECPLKLSPKKAWKMRVGFTYVKTSVFQVYMSGMTYANAPYIAVGTDYIIDCGLSDGTSRITYIKGKTVLTDNTDYIIELSYDGISTYTIKLKTGTGDWITENTYTYDGNVQFGTDLCIGRNGSGYCRGSINLANTYVEMAGTIMWKPATTHYSGTWAKL